MQAQRKKTIAVMSCERRLLSHCLLFDAYAFMIRYENVLAVFAESNHSFFEKNKK